METAFLNKLIQTLPLAYAYHKVQLDQNDQVEDYVFVDINEAFEKMTGLRADTTKGKRVTEVIPGIREDSFNWIEFYGNIATTGVSKEFTQYTNALGRWYKVTAFSPEMYYFVTVFQDITPEMEQKLSLEKQKEQLRSALRDYEIIFDGNLDPMSLFELHDGKYVYLRINAVHRKVTGFSLPDIRGRGLVDVYGHETGEKLQQYLDSCVQSRTPLNYEMTYDFPNGVRKWATTLIPVFDADNVQYVVASSRDITEVETLRQENVELAERLEVMFQNHMAVMIIVDPFTGRIKDANPSACNFYGYSKDELVAMSIQDINLLAPDVVEQRRIEALKES